MAINPNNGVLDIINGTLKVSSIDIKQAAGFTTALNTVARNDVLLFDDQKATTVFTPTSEGGYMSSTGVTRDTTEGAGYIDLNDGWVYWPLQLPNSWHTEFDMHVTTTGGVLTFSLFNTSEPNHTDYTNNDGGYKIVFDNTNNQIDIYWEGSIHKTVGANLRSSDWQHVNINYFQGAISVSLAGKVVLTHEFTQNYQEFNSRYVGFSATAGASHKIRHLRVHNSDKWLYTKTSNASDITYVSGNVGIGTLEPTELLDVHGNVHIARDLTVDGNLTVSGTTTFIDTANMSIEDPIIELARGNASDTIDAGLVITRATSNVAVAYRGDEGELAIGYTQSGASDADVVPVSDGGLDVRVYGNLFANNLTTTANVEATYFKGNGSELTHVTLDQVVGYGNVTSNTIQLAGLTATGNVEANYFVGDGSKLTDLVTDLQSVTDNGNVTSNTIQFTNVTTAFVADSNVGIGTRAPAANLHVVGHQYVNDPPTIANAFDHSDAPLTLTHATPTSTTAIDDPKSVLHLTRDGTSGESYGSKASFKMSRYENSGTASRSRLDVALTDGTYTESTVMTLRADGKVGVGTTTPGYTLDVRGTANVGALTATSVSGDGSGLSGIQSSNVSDFASNVTRIGNLETDLTSNVTRIGNLETDLISNVTRIGNLETDLTSNVTRIVSIESGEHTFTGTKTFENDVILESNLHIKGDVLVANTINMVVSDPIIELGSNNLNTGDLGIVMSRHGGTNSNVAIIFDESDDILRLGYTLGSAYDTSIGMDANLLTMNVRGNLDVSNHVSANSLTINTVSVTTTMGLDEVLNVSNTSTNTIQITNTSDTALDVTGGASVGSNLQVGTANLFVDTTTGRVGVGTLSPDGRLHICSGTSGDCHLILHADTDNNNETDNPKIMFRQDGAIYTAEIGIENSGNKLALRGTNGIAFYDGSPSSTDIDYIESTSTELMRIDTSGNVGIGTTSPAFKLDVHGTSNVGALTATSGTFSGALVINGGPENNTTPALTIGGGIYDESDLYVLNTYNVSTGVGYAAKVIGVNIKNKVETDNSIQIRQNTGGLTSAGAIYLGSDDVNQGIFGVLGGTGVAGSTLGEYLTVKANGNVGIGTANPGSELDVNGTISATHVSLGTKLYPTLGGKWFTIHSSTFDGDLGDQYPDPDGGILFTNQSSSGGFPWGYYMGVVKDVAGTNGTTQRFDIGKSYDLNTSDYTTGADTLTPYLTIDNGNVGIGTTSPATALDVAGSFRVRGGNTSTFGNDGLLHINSRSTTHGSETVALQTTIDSRALTAANPGTHGGESRNVLALQPDGGYVGIGTVSPTYKLNVLTDTNYDGISLRDSTRELLKIAKGNNGCYINMFDTGVSKVNISTTGNTWLNGGNVGIGTTSPSYKLHVVGNGKFTGDLTVDGKIYNYNYTEVDINAPTAVSGTWSSSDSSGSWGDPKFNNTYDKRRYNDAPGYVEYTIPTGMKSAYVSQLQWSSGGYVDIHGVQSDGGLVFLRRINTRQRVENTNEGNPDQHDGSTITFAATGLQHYSKIRLTNKVGRFHMTGLAFTPNENEGTEGTGMVHTAQISDLSGHPVQYVGQNVNNIVSYNSSTGRYITPLDITITPKFSNSKIMLHWVINSESHHDQVFRVYRGSTLIGYNTNSTGNWSGAAPVHYDTDHNSTLNTQTVVWVDTPNTTSAVTYRIYTRPSNTGTNWFNLNRTVGGVVTGQANHEIAVSYKSAMEIAV